MNTTSCEIQTKGKMQVSIMSYKLLWKHGTLKDTLGCQEDWFVNFSKDASIKLERVTKIQPDSMQCSFSRLYGGLEYPASRGFFLVSLLACTKSFASRLVFRVRQDVSAL